MASCTGCGRTPLRKNRQNIFYCRRCGPRQTYPATNPAMLEAVAKLNIQLENTP